MYKNQLQELAQRSCFNLPAYSCIREGPDHAPRFKATVNFNGEIFESPTYCSTLRQAEHAAAEVALITLSRRGPSQYLASRILDETGVCKNLLQETAQRAGVSLPVYTTIRSGPGHLPVFKCIVDVGGRTFVGEAAKTKKQAEKNAALAAWSAIKLLTAQSSQLPLLRYSEACDEPDRCSSNGVMSYRRDDRVAGSHHSSQAQSSQLSATHSSFGGGPRMRTVNVRDRNRMKREASPAGQFFSGPSSSSALVERGFDAGHSHGRYLQYSRTPAVAPVVGNGGPSLVATVHQRSRSLPGVESPYLSRDFLVSSSSAAGMGGNAGRSSMPVQLVRGLSLQSRSERFELKKALLDELNQIDGDGILRGEKPIRGLPLQSRSERFELKPSLLEELHQRDEDEWLRGELSKPVSERESSCLNNGELSSFVSSAFSSSLSPSYSMWPRSAQWRGPYLPSGATSSSSAVVNSFRNLSACRPARNLAPPVRVRHTVPVHSAPPRRTDAIPHRTDPQNLGGVASGSVEDEASLSRQFLSTLRL